MKKVILFLLLFPLLAMSQTNEEYLIFESATLTPDPAKITEFENALAEHNKKFHGEGLYSARVHMIANGPNTGSYHWVMGPLPWSEIDGRPGEEEGHDADWTNNVVPYFIPGSGNLTYWKLESDVSHFPNDFTIKNLLVDYYDIKRFKGEDALKLLEKIKKVFVERYPEDIVGIYTNQFPSTKEGRDLSIISFFDNSGWLGEDREFRNQYDTVHGEGSFEHFLKDWEAVTDGIETELWTFRPDLSGINGDVKVAERQ